MSESESNHISAEGTKILESESWSGPLDHDNKVNSAKESYADRWDEFLVLSCLINSDLVGKSVVNVGVGHGKEAELLLSKGAGSVVLVDIAPGQLKSALIRKYQHGLDNLELVRCDAERLCFKDHTFDIGFIKMALHHFPNHCSAISEVFRVADKVVFIDIMNCSLTKFLNKLGLFRVEWNGSEPNRLKIEEVEKIFAHHRRNLTISYYFVPPYYGDSVALLSIIERMSRIVNTMLPRSHTLSRIFGNVAIISG
ncbi:methyltransferase domain-containing protein [Methanoculleus sp.]|uniref:class I SAM-dependent methyltransferase n=1 Tax=Methanoculleus sp. TaxID=90427 RepID=UPI0026327DEE|nr:methyltransferase domain-containing protein [Methanoculleus sp.]MDI6867733.1 methyltransferase domain-containing protein [Methanoculleus sp.]